MPSLPPQSPPLPPNDSHGFPFDWHGAPALLSVPHPAGAATDAVAQALALEPWLPLVDALERWLGAPLRLGAPLPRDNRRAGELLNLGVGREGDSARCELALPVARLSGAALGPFAPGWVLHWPRIVCDMLIEVWPDAALDAARFEPGALLLLPASFDSTAPERRVRLTAAAHGARAARWRGSECRLGPNDALPSPPSAAHAWAAVALRAVSFDAQHWYGCTPAPPPHAEVRIDALELRYGGRLVASGRLAPAGRGHGLLIEQVDSAGGAFAAPLGAAA
jgi:hypothetical protein